jgi:hypothetical protein
LPREKTQELRVPRLVAQLVPTKFDDLLSHRCHIVTVGPI